ncbi:MAG: methyltransferase domain-containing protein [Streptosporangiales bacterium]|nr:methyltransferase domain-containing protein [Streptosporangiales bacterium]
MSARDKSGTEDLAFRADLARTLGLLRAFRREQTDPEHFYTLLARDTVAQLGRYAPLAGARALDVGCGPGYFTRALRAAGADVAGVDADPAELTLHGAEPYGAVLGSALRLPFADASFDVCLSSNVLEHVPDPWRMAGEMIRVTRPGGTVYLAFTNWLSPWGGHETSPWHYLGGERAARRFERRTGRVPKNRYGQSLHAVSVSAALTWARRAADAELVAALPRYLPRWARPVVAVPGLREVVTWNLALVLRRR